MTVKFKVASRTEECKNCGFCDLICTHQDNCTGCGACVDACPYEAKILQIRVQENGAKKTELCGYAKGERGFGGEWSSLCILSN